MVYDSSSDKCAYRSSDWKCTLTPQFLLIKTTKMVYKMADPQKTNFSKMALSLRWKEIKANPLVLFHVIFRPTKCAPKNQNRWKFHFSHMGPHCALTWMSNEFLRSCWFSWWTVYTWTSSWIMLLRDTICKESNAEILPDCEQSEQN